MPRAAIALAILTLIAATARAQEFDPSKTVIAIHKIRPSLTYKGLGAKIKYATGFCLDPDCRFIGTNYHVAEFIKLPLKIKGVEASEKFLATGPDDADAQETSGVLGSGMPTLKYNRSRDLAVFELRRPLAPKFHGIALSRDDLAKGQEADIYAFPKGINPRRSLVRFHAKYIGETQDYLQAFEYDDSGGEVRPGSSGGIIVSGGKIVSVLMGTEISGKAIALGVPVQNLADFLSKSLPYLHTRLFPDDTKYISPTAADFYPEWIPPAPRADSTHIRPEEPPEVKAVREYSQALADSMNNYIAVQSFEWGRDNHQPFAIAQYEVQVVDGWQTWRAYPDGKKRIYEHVPLPRADTVMGPAGEWSELPKRVGSVLNLKVHQAPDAAVNGKRVLVFQYRADVEDRICEFRHYDDLLLFSLHQDKWVACYGEVWTDADYNVLRISEHDHELSHGWSEYYAVVTYGWLEKSGVRKLIPVTIDTQMQFRHRIYWCRGQFTNYREFGVTMKVGKSEIPNRLP